MATDKFSRRSRAKRAVVIGEALQRLTATLGIGGRLREMRVLEVWKDVVGEQIARVTEAERVEQGTLYVSVASAPWRAELTLRRIELMEKINAVIGGKAVTDIRFR